MRLACCQSTPDLVAGLCEMVAKLGCILGFDNDPVNYMLQSKNFQLFVEDEHFLSSIFPEVNESLFPSEQPRGFYGCRFGDRKSILRPAKPMKSTGFFSLDCLKGWETSLFSFKQAIVNMEESASNSM
jgi:hypothetical protein